MRAMRSAGVLLAVSTGCVASPETPIEGSVAAADGVSIAYDDRGEGEPALVLVHGWACSREFWREQRDELARKHRVVCIDLPGHGRSGVDREHWSIDGLGADVQTVVDALQLDDVVLVGHSMGGPVSLAAARRMPGRVRGILAVDTLHNVEQQIPEEAIHDLAARFEADMRGNLEAVIPAWCRPDADPELVRWIVDQAARTDPRPAAGLFRDFAVIRPREMLRQAGVPVRAINAQPTDGVQLAPTMADINRKYGDFQHVEMPGVGHFLMLERPAEFNALMWRELEAFGR